MNSNTLYYNININQHSISDNNVKLTLNDILHYNLEDITIYENLNINSSTLNKTFIYDINNYFLYNIDVKCLNIIRSIYNNDITTFNDIINDDINSINTVIVIKDNDKYITSYYPLKDAIICENTYIIDILINKGACPNLIDKYTGMTPIFFARNKYILSYLLSHNIFDINAIDCGGNNIMFNYMLFGYYNYDYIEYMLSLFNNNYENKEVNILYYFCRYTNFAIYLATTLGNIAKSRYYNIVYDELEHIRNTTTMIDIETSYYDNVYNIIKLFQSKNIKLRYDILDYIIYDNIYYDETENNIDYNILLMIYNKDKVDVINNKNQDTLLLFLTKQKQIQKIKYNYIKNVFDNPIKKIFADSVNILDEESNSPLTHICKYIYNEGCNNYEDILFIFLRNGGDLASFNMFGETPISLLNEVYDNLTPKLKTLCDNNKSILNVIKLCDFKYDKNIIIKSLNNITLTGIDIEDIVDHDDIVLHSNCVFKYNEVVNHIKHNIKNIGYLLNKNTVILNPYTRTIMIDFNDIHNTFNALFINIGPFKNMFLEYLLYILINIK